MNTEFAHLDCPWLLLNYVPRKNSSNSMFFALTNIGIMLPVKWNKTWSTGKNGVKGKDIIEYVYNSPVELLFERHLGLSGSHRSGSLRNGTKSPYFKFYTYKNLNLLKNNMLSRLDRSKTYFKDRDLYHLGDGMFEDAKRIDPYFAASLSQIREVKYSIVHEDRSQTRDRFKISELQMLMSGKLILQKTTEFDSVIIPEYEVYLNIDKTRKISYIYINEREKNMNTIMNNHNQMGKKIMRVFNKHQKRRKLEVTQIIIMINNEFNMNLDPLDQKTRKNMLASLKLLCDNKLLIKTKKGTYSLSNLSMKKQSVVTANIGEKVSSSISSDIDQIKEELRKELREEIKKELIKQVQSIN